MANLKGIVVHADGKPVTDAKIILTALQNSNSMLKDVETVIETVNGEYMFSIQPGLYAVKLAQTNQYDKELGGIQVYEDSLDGTLNQYLVHAKTDLTPEALRQYEMLAQQAQSNAQKAAQVLEDAINASIKGEKGDTGEQGPQGLKGDTGATGPKGDTGLQGLKGDTGTTGQQEPKGDKGDTGPQGIPGPKGEPGESGLGSVKTDGITITGDGNTTPLALGPGVMDGIGSYIFALCPIAASNNAQADGSGRLNWGDTVPGSKLIAARFNNGTYASPMVTGGYGEISGTWQYLGGGFSWDYTNALFRRIA